MKTTPVTQDMIRLHAAMTQAEAIGAWGLAQVFRKMLQSLILGGLLLAQACATGPTYRYVWVEGPGKTHDQMYQDDKRCRLHALDVPNGPYGVGQERYIQACMKIEGHTLEREEEI